MYNTSLLEGRTAENNVGGRVVTIPQSTSSSLLDDSKEYTVCYSSEGDDDADAWQDSYIHFKITKLAYIQHTVGKWTDYAGQTIKHLTLGQLPNQYSGATGLEIDYFGSLGSDNHISFVDASLGASTLHGITYYQPCDSGSIAAETTDSVHSGVLTASGTTISTLDSTVLLTSKTYALCYAEGAGDTADSTWADSGIRITFPRVINVQYGSGHSGIQPRDMTSIFYMTNVLPKYANMELTYVGDLPSGMSLSLVDASLTTTGSTLVNPCVDGVNAAAAADVYHSGVLTATGNVVTVPQDDSERELDKITTFAVCYAEVASAASTDAWYDSYIRLRISMVKDLTVGGVTIRTAGQIPNVNEDDLYYFTYDGALATNKYLSFVDETENTYNPCLKTIAGETATTSQRSGAKQAQVSTKSIKTFDTASLSTDVTFALCYSEGDGTIADSTWKDSGIRVTTPKVWNVLLESGVIGPDCVLPTDGPVRDDCKEDTKARDMTSYPHTTNRIPQTASVELKYWGSLSDGQYISIVDVSLDPNNNPCSDPLIAGADADSTHSGPLVADSASKYITIPQTTLLDETKVYAVCYDDSSALPPHVTANRLYGDFAAVPVTPSLQGNSGTNTSTTWRDTFIRLKMSQIAQFRVSISNMPVSNTPSWTAIRTNGQIPMQAAGQQVQYECVGSLAENEFISLVDITTNPATDSDTSIIRPDPCASISSSSDVNSLHSGLHQAGTSDKLVTTLDSENSGGVELDASATFALCYGVGPEPISALEDSGIRITVSKVTMVKYLDMKFNNPTTAEVYSKYTREMTSITRATNKFPQEADQYLVYDGLLAAQKWLALIDNTENEGVDGPNPCLNPAVTSLTGDSTHSGASKGASSGSVAYQQKTVTFAQDTLLDESKVYAVCYAEGDGTASDYTWRDTYIRLTMTKVTTIVSYAITHQVSGQIPNHAELKIDYTGSLATDKRLSFFDQTLVNYEVLSGSGQTYPFPCSDTSIAGAAASSSQAHGQAASSTTTLTVDTTGMDTEKTFAVCYTESDSLSETVWVDSGIRITVPQIYNVQADSGYSGITGDGFDGTPVRDMKSWDQTNGTYIIDRPTNRFPRERMQTLNYIVHETASSYASPEGHFISLVDSALNGDDPCVLGTTAAAAEGIQNSNVAEGGGATGTIVTIHQDSTPGDDTDSNTADLLDGNPLTTFAVCYSIATGDASTDGTAAASWKDSYVRLKLTKVTHIVTIGVTTRTFGQIPNTPAADEMRIDYSGNLDNTKWLALVDEDINPTANGVGNPCTKDYAANPASPQYSGSHRALSMKEITTLNTQILDTGKVFAVCYAESSGDPVDESWADSGIRVTVPAVWNALYQSGHTGPECSVTTVLNTNCKLDTKARDQTSKPLATNRIPREAGVELTYVGTMLENRYVSLVDSTQNNNNPCVSGAIAGGTPLEVGGGGAIDARLTSGPILANTDTKTIVIPQAANDLLDKEKIYAVCYDEGIDISPTTTTYTTGTMGTSTSTTWRDSYIRLKVTLITTFDVSVTDMPFANTFTKIPIRTVGQIPNQAGYKQVTYSYTGSLSTASFISLVDDSAGSEEDELTGITLNNPCEDSTEAMQEGPSDALHTGTLLIYTMSTADCAPLTNRWKCVLKRC